MTSRGGKSEESLAVERLEEVSSTPELADASVALDVVESSADLELSDEEVVAAGPAPALPLLDTPDVPADIQPEGGEVRFRVLRKLGNGGMAHVYKARAIYASGFERDVALKRVLPEESGNALLRDMFLDEGQLSLRLPAHPNIIPATGLHRVGDGYLLVMEYVAGRTLRDVYVLASKKGHRLSAELACYVTAEVADALDCVHGLEDEDGEPLGVVHRDVSADNVLLADTGHVRLFDFGVAYSEREGRRAKTVVGPLERGFKGKPSYASPEQAMGLPLSGKSDQWSLGIVLVELLTGVKPFKGRSMEDTLERVREGSRERILDVIRDVPSALQHVIVRMLSRNAADRFPTCADVAHALREYVAGQGRVFAAAQARAEVERLERAPELSPEEREATRAGRRRAVAAEAAVPAPVPARAVERTPFLPPRRPAVPTPMPPRAPALVPVPETSEAPAPVEASASEPGADAYAAGETEYLGKRRRKAVPVEEARAARRWSVPVALASAVLLVLGVVGALWLQHRRSSAPVAATTGATAEPGAQAAGTAAGAGDVSRAPAVTAPPPPAPTPAAEAEAAPTAAAGAPAEATGAVAVPAPAEPAPSAGSAPPPAARRRRVPGDTKAGASARRSEVVPEPPVTTLAAPEARPQVPQGTLLPVCLTSHADTAAPGPFTADVAQDVRVEGATLVPHGSSVECAATGAQEGRVVGQCSVLETYEGRRPFQGAVLGRDRQPGLLPPVGTRVPKGTCFLVEVRAPFTP